MAIIHPGTPSSLLTELAEATPTWLLGDARSVSPLSPEATNSRWAFYPGSDIDGTPIRVFASTRACHFFVYADVGTDVERFARNALERGLLGYDMIREIPAVIPARPGFPDRLPGESPTSHEGRLQGARFYAGLRGKDDPRLDAVRPTEFEATFYVFERGQNFPDGHGADRIALLFVHGEAVDFFFRTIQMGWAPPFAILLRRYMSYDFVRDPSLWEVAEAHRAGPRYILGDIGEPDIDEPWHGYCAATSLPDAGSRAGDRLYQRWGSALRR